MGIHLVGDKDPSVKHVRCGTGAGSFVVGVCCGRGQWVRDHLVARDTGKAPRRNGLLRHVGVFVCLIIRLDEVDLYPISQSVKWRGGVKACLFPGFDLIPEVLVNRRNIPGQGLYVELLANTSKLQPAALGTEGGSLAMRRLRPLKVLLARFFRRVRLEHDNVLIGDGAGGDFRHG